MKLTKKEAEKIVKLYDLGELKKFKLNPGGAVNYNFDFHTSKGIYIIRILGHKMTKWKKEKLELEFELLDFLKNNEFPYKVPEPLKNNIGKFLFKLNNNYFWVYEKIPGKVNYKYNNLREVAKALATFHKLTKKFNLNLKQKYYDLNWLSLKYFEIRRKISHLKKMNKVDKLVEDNLNLFESALNRIIKINYSKNIILTHSDFGVHNFLFKGNKITALLDFDNLGSNPRAKEISYPLRRLCFVGGRLSKLKMKLFLKEYEKIIKIKKEEKDILLPMMVLDNCNVFWWVYMEMKKIHTKNTILLKKW